MKLIARERLKDTDLSSIKSKRLTHRLTWAWQAKGRRPGGVIGKDDNGAN